MMFSKFPPGDHFNVTHQIMHQHQVGAVIGAGIKKVYGDDYTGSPDFSTIDQQLTESNGLTQHLHPVLHRRQTGVKQDFHLLHGRVQQLAMPIVDRYADKVPRMTLSSELTLCKPELWAEIVELYELVATRYPHLELWISDFAVRQPMDRDGILTRLEDLNGIAHGFITSDYIELSRSDRNQAIQYLKVRAIGQVPIRSRFSYLCEFWKELRQMDFKYALETSAFADEDTTLIRDTQQRLYQALVSLCDRQDAELWLWCLADDASRDFQDPDRRPHAGVFDRTGVRRCEVVFK